jgi:hypothetical protein
MPLAGHALDHLPDDILNVGPLTALWEFMMEQSMGEVACSVTSCIYTFLQLANTLIQCKQLKVVQMQYPDMNQELNYSEECCDWNEISYVEMYFPDINNCIILWTPHGQYTLTSTKKVTIAMYFWGLLELKASLQFIKKYLPDQVKQWGKMHFKGDAECVRSR